MKKFEKSKIKGKEKYENVAIIVQEPSSYEIELQMVEEEKSTYSNCLLLDFACFNYVCFKKEWFVTYYACGGKVVKLLIAIIWILLERAL